MDDLIPTLRSYVTGMWKYRWYALTIAWLVSIAGWVIVARIPDQYVSSARVYIDTQSMLRPLMRGIAADINTSALAQLDLVRRTLLSQPNIDQIMRETDLDIRAETPAEMDRIAASLSARIRVASAGPDLFTISFTDDEPALAHDVVSTVLNLFVESNIGANRKQLDETQEFLTQQINQLQEELTKGERALAEFEMKNRGYLPGASNFESRLQAARSDLATLESERSRALRVRDEMNRELATTIRDIRANEPALSPQAARVEELKQNLNELELRYTELHPDIILTKRLLEREQALLESTDVEDKIRSHPAVQQIQSQIQQQDTVIELYDEQIARNEAEIAELEEKLVRVPEVEAKQAQMRRDLGVIRQNYEAFVARREQARYAEKLDVQTDAVQFRIVDPPTTPTRPVGPNRPLLRSGVFGGAVAGGIAFAAILWLASGTFSDARRLEEVFGRPVIGTISQNAMTVDRGRKLVETTAFGILAVCLVSAYGLVIMNPAFLSAGT